MKRHFSLQSIRGSPQWSEAKEREMLRGNSWQTRIYHFFYNLFDCEAKSKAQHPKAHTGWTPLSNMTGWSGMINAAQALSKVGRDDSSSAWLTRNPPSPVARSLSIDPFHMSLRGGARQAAKISLRRRQQQFL